MNVALATDHAGFEAMKHVKIVVERLGHTWMDFGPTTFDPVDDYPDFIFPAAHAVARGTCVCGIIMGGSGQGEAMAANRVVGVRCAVFYAPAIAHGAIDAAGQASVDPYAIVKLARQHNDANMLSLASRFLTAEQMERALMAWFQTPFSGEERHARRIAKLEQR